MGIKIRATIILILLWVIAMLALPLIMQNLRAKPTQERHSTGDNLSFATIGIASWYSNEEYPPGSLMANGEEFDDRKLTCASWFYPLGTWVRISSSLNDKSVICEVTDHGPAKSLIGKGRIIDLSKAAFARIADLEWGIIQVQIEIVE